MKAIRVHEFGGPEVLRLEEVPTPQPGPGEVLVRMHATGINPVETYIRAGKVRAIARVAIHTRERRRGRGRAGRRGCE